MAFFIGTRKVKLVRGPNTQTVNVYENRDENDIHMDKVRIAGEDLFVTDEFLQAQKFSSADEMISFLITERGGRVEQVIGETGYTSPKSMHPLISVDDLWTEAIIPEVEKAINRLVDEFVQLPYLHRVEHSLHCQLYGFLVESSLLAGVVNYGEVIARTVQKEWPETLPRRDEKDPDRKRGNFDLAILGPPALDKGNHMTIEDFKDGRIRPAVVIEVGLDYPLKHLAHDVTKLTHSEVRHGYLVHLARPRGEPRKDVEEYVERLIGSEGQNGAHRIAYAQVDEKRKDIRYRRLGGQLVRSNSVKKSI